MLVASSIAFSQSKHMTFKGIPMEGTLNSFVQKLKAKGYVYKSTTDGVAFMEGEFAATKGCTILVNRFSDKDQVNLVAVIFPEEKTWNAIISEYNTIGELLTEKYGVPETEERFHQREPGDPELKFYALLKDECTFMKQYNVENGRIVLTMAKMGFQSASVILRYLDDANVDQIRQKMLEDL